MKDLTDRIVASYDEDDHFDPDTCPVCGSEFSHTFWIHCTFVRQDGRFKA